MDRGDVGQPVVKIRGNRAYICKWEVEEHLAHWQMRELGMTNGIIIHHEVSIFNIINHPNACIRYDQRNKPIRDGWLFTKIGHVAD
jgi:hypothetical protein